MVPGCRSARHLHRMCTSRASYPAHLPSVVGLAVDLETPPAQVRSLTDGAQARHQKAALLQLAIRLGSLQRHCTAHLLHSSQASVPHLQWGLGSSLLLARRMRGSRRTRRTQRWANSPASMHPAVTQVRTMSASCEPARLLATERECGKLRTWPAPPKQRTCATSVHKTHRTLVS